VTLDRQSIERRDFPIGRRGYEPAAVDSHLRSLAAEVDELERSLDERGGWPISDRSLGSAAGSQVQSILEAAEATAVDIEQQAAQAAATTRAEADNDAARTRSDAIAQAQAHVRAVSQATAALLEKVESMDQEVGALVQSLRAGAGRLVSDLRALETNMGELYDAASGSGRSREGGSGLADSTVAVDAERAAAPAPAPPVAGPGTAGASAVNGSSERVPPVPAASTSLPAPTVSAAPATGAEDLDGARLIALNMALNGEPREQAERYLAENFELSDREKLLDEVYAAIEG